MDRYPNKTRPLAKPPRRVNERANEWAHSLIPWAELPVGADVRAKWEQVCRHAKPGRLSTILVHAPDLRPAAGKPAKQSEGDLDAVWVWLLGCSVDQLWPKRNAVFRGKAPSRGAFLWGMEHVWRGWRTRVGVFHCTERRAAIVAWDPDDADPEARWPWFLGFVASHDPVTQTESVLRENAFVTLGKGQQGKVRAFGISVAQANRLARALIRDRP